MGIKTYYFIFTLLLFTSFKGLATSYYINPELGHDKNNGISVTTPFKSLEKVNSLKLLAGDKILLAADYTFYGSLRLQNVKGTAKDPIIISSYYFGDEYEEKRAIIDAKGYLNGVHLKDCSFIEISDLIITANADGLKSGEPKEKNMRCGVLVDVVTDGNYEHIYLKNLLIKDIFWENIGYHRGASEVKTANGKQSYGWGIRFINKNKKAIIKDIKVDSCTVRNVGHTGIKFTARRGKDKQYSIQNIEIRNNRIIETGGPGIQMSGVFNGHISENYIDHSGSDNDSRKWGRGSGLWTWGSANVLIERNYFLNANGPGDSAGAHIDFNCKNIIIQYNFSANNAGGFCEILGNNYNCAYRYNISVNDGYRTKGENGAFQEGKIFWLSGFQGNKKKREGPFNSYFYNNTIFVNKDIVAKIAIDKASSGVLIVNNIFYIEGESKLVIGDQYKPDEGGESLVKNIIFKNNLYLQETNWPKDILIQDAEMIIGNPRFVNNGGNKITDYISLHTKLIKDKGIEIQKIPEDKIGLYIGLKAAHDILGNKIIGKPDLGAIELN